MVSRGARRPGDKETIARYPRPFAPVLATTSLRCCDPACAAGVACGVRGCGWAGGLRRVPVAGGGSRRERDAGRRQRVGARAKGFYFSYTLRACVDTPAL